MLYRKIIAVCSQIHTKHTNTLCGQNVVLLNPMVHTVTTVLSRQLTSQHYVTCIIHGSPSLTPHKTVHSVVTRKQNGCHRQAFFPASCAVTVLQTVTHIPPLPRFINL